MPALKVITLGAKGEDLVRGTISLGPSGIQIDPPTSALLNKMIKPFRVSWLNKVVGPQDGEAFMSELLTRYSSPYLRVISIPDPQTAQSTASTDQLRGGKADSIPPENFPVNKVTEGAKVESEHTSNPAVAEEITRDHLREDPDYYTKLKAIEGKPGGKRPSKKSD